NNAILLPDVKKVFDDHAASKRHIKSAADIALSAAHPSSGNRRSLRQSVAAASSSSSSSAVSVGHNSESKKKEELEKAVNQLQNRLTKIREEKLLEDLKLKAADKAEAVLLANCGWEGARLMH